MYKFDCFIFRVVLSRSTRVARGQGEKKEKYEMKIRFTSIPEKNVYNIIKVIPNSFYCLHYASIQLGTVHLQTDHVIFTVPSPLSTKSNRRLFSFILLRPAIMAVGCCYFISIFILKTHDNIRCMLSAVN